MAVNKDYVPNVRFCLKCGDLLNNRESLVVEYWEGDRTVYVCWCHKCGWKGETSDIVKFAATELDEE